MDPAGPAGGAAIGEVAAYQGRSINMVRTHVARLMAKTGVSRQGSLIRLLTRLPGTFPDG